MTGKSNSIFAAPRIPLEAGGRKCTERLTGRKKSSLRPFLASLITAVLKLQVT
jgi:hypothetical protein